MLRIIRSSRIIRNTWSSRWRRSRIQRRISLPPGLITGPISRGIGIDVIVTAVIQAATAGYVSATAVATTGTAESAHTPIISKLKWLYLSMICGVATKNDAPKI